MKKEQSADRAEIHHLYTQTIKYRSAEIALQVKLKDIWSKYRNAILHNKGLPEERKLALKYMPDETNNLLQEFHAKHHVVINISQHDSLDQDFPFNIEMEYEGDDLPFTNPDEAGAAFPLRTMIFDLNSGLDAQLKSAKEYLEVERINTAGEFTLEPAERRTSLQSIQRNLSFLVEKDRSRKTYEELSKEYKVNVSTLKTRYATAQKLLNSCEIHRIFSPFPSGKQSKFRLTL
jgi:hypothetical protein